MFWPFRSRDWKQQPKRVFDARDPDTGIVRRVTLTNADILTFNAEGRVYIYAKSRRQDAADATARAWGFTGIVELDPKR